MSVEVEGAISSIPELTPLATVVGSVSVDGYDAADVVFSIDQQYYEYYNSEGRGSVSLFALVGNKVVTSGEMRYDPPYDDHRTFTYHVAIRAEDTAGHYLGSAYLEVSVTDVLDDIRGTSGIDKLVGDYGMNKLIGGAGNDKLYGQRGDDVLYGGTGKDVLSGGYGADTFLYKSIKESTLKAPDVISTWDHTGGNAIRDRIDLHTIDANTKVSGAQDFKWIGAKGFTGHAGELRYVQEKSHTYVYADVNGDKKADFAIDLLGSHKIYADDFLL